jgi:hypothetical protein
MVSARGRGRRRVRPPELVDAGLSARSIRQFNSLKNSMWTSLSPASNSLAELDDRKRSERLF